MYSTRPFAWNLRFSCFTLGVGLIAALSACGYSAYSKKGITDKSFLTPTSQGTLQEFHFGDPVVNESQAHIAAQSALRASFNYMEPLTVVEVKPMSYLDYSNFIGTANDMPTGTQVWLIVYFDNQWQFIPSTPRVTPVPPFRGCVSVAINAADGLALRVGGPLQTGKIPECDP
ncbi:MAG: hypothetical protein ABSB41_17625 [Anaerolineales bacterium]|jgi:hypothetical protein